MLNVFRILHDSANCWSTLTMSLMQILFSVLTIINFSNKIILVVVLSYTVELNFTGLKNLFKTSVIRFYGEVRYLISKHTKPNLLMKLVHICHEFVLSMVIIIKFYCLYTFFVCF